MTNIFLFGSYLSKSIALKYLHGFTDTNQWGIRCYKLTGQKFPCKSHAGEVRQNPPTQKMQHDKIKENLKGVEKKNSDTPIPHPKQWWSAWQYNLWSGYIKTDPAAECRNLSPATKGALAGLGCNQFKTPIGARGEGYLGRSCCPGKRDPKDATRHEMTTR